MGISQLKKIDTFTQKRREIAKIYNSNFSKLNIWLIPLTQKYDSAYHIYIIKLRLENLKVDRNQIFQALQAEGLGVNVHYKPIHLHTFYKDKFNTSNGMFPVAEEIYNKIITLPLFPTMRSSDINDVIVIVNKVIKFYSK